MSAPNKTPNKIDQELAPLIGTDVIVCFLLLNWAEHAEDSTADSFASVAGTLSHDKDAWKVDSNKGSHALIAGHRVNKVVGRTIYINVLT